ncbi:putative RNA-binding protein [Porphyridium purpureum]|uniref:Putative RNA-binding protein n=1 Tax=Porphyridium purpureum TaxID=35688 RepID=A0A5J4YLM3_PORPP|nr:putative RNA-binding protein [Porphyridium purpureum]|eukprot:POR4482..scf249_10
MEVAGEGAAGAPNTRVFVGNLSWETRWQGLKDHMRAAGNVSHAEVFIDASGRSAGCGVVEYETPEEADAAIHTLTDSQLDGRAIFFGAPGGGGGGFNRDRFEQEKGRKVVVLNLPFTCRWQHLKDIFRTSGGNVIRADIIMGQDGRSKGIGTVLFETEEEAQRAIDEMNGAEVDGRLIEVRMDRGPQPRRDQA